MPIETYKCLIFRGSSPIWIHGLQIRITRRIVIGRLSKQQQAISGKRANVWGVSEWPLRIHKFTIHKRLTGEAHSEVFLNYMKGTFFHTLRKV
jgi:hypothetical protein